MEAITIEKLIRKAEFIHRGAESDLYRVKYLGLNAILKWRRPKPYRDSRLDEAIRHRRMSREIQLMHRAKKAEINVPYIYYVSRKDAFFIMEEIQGILLRKYLNDNGDWKPIAIALGDMIGKMHNISVIHGDLTTSNIIVTPNSNLYIIDFGLGSVSDDIEERAVDIELFHRVLTSSHTRIAKSFFKLFINKYIDTAVNGENVYKRYKAIRRMGRYIEREKRIWK